MAPGPAALAHDTSIHTTVVKFQILCYIGSQEETRRGWHHPGCDMEGMSNHVPGIVSGYYPIVNPSPEPWAAIRWQGFVFLRFSTGDTNVRTSCRLYVRPGLHRRRQRGCRQPPCSTEVCERTGAGTPARMVRLHGDQCGPEAEPHHLPPDGELA